MLNNYVNLNTIWQRAKTYRNTWLQHKRNSWWLSERQVPEINITIIWSSYKKYRKICSYYLFFEKHYNDILPPKSVSVLHTYLKLLYDIQKNWFYLFFNKKMVKKKVLSTLLLNIYNSIWNVTRWCEIIWACHTVKNSHFISKLNLSNASTRRRFTIIG